MSVPNTFASATGSIPLSQLDANFAYYDAGIQLTGSAVTFSGSTTFSTGTANGVAYLNASKVLTTGSALTFDGTTFSNTNAIKSVVDGANINNTGAGLVAQRSTDDSQIYIGYRTTPDAWVIAATYSSTGAYKPIAFAVNDAEKMRLTSTGLGIGTSSPGYKLDVNGTARLGGNFNTDADSVVILDGPVTLAAGATQSYKTQFEVDSSTTYINSNQYYGGGAWQVYDSTKAPAAIYLSSGNANSYISLRTSNANSGQSIERVRVDYLGNVGIGTSSPAKLLDVSSASSPTIRITNTTDWASSSTGLVGALEFYTTDPSTPGARVLSYIQSYNNAGSSVPEGNLYFGTALGGGSGAAATTKMVLDSSGNLGIGTSSPGYKLDVIGTARIQSSSGYNFFFQTSGTTARINYLNDAFSANISAAYRATDFVWQKGDGSDVLKLDSSGNLGLGVTPSAWGAGEKVFEISGGGHVAFANSVANYTANAYYNGGYLYKTSAAATKYAQFSGYHAWYTAASGTAGNAITFTQAMTLDSSGNLLVGTTSSGVGNVNGLVLAGNSSTAGQIAIGHVSGTASGQNYANFLYNSSTIGSITQSGTTAVLYNVTSDQRLKENIQDAESASALIDALQVRKYDWKSDGSHQRYGFVAQELVTVAPEAVHQPEDPEEMMAVDYSKLVPMLVKEIQSLRARVAQLESK